MNNAGITADDLLLRMKPEAWDAVIAANLDSAFLCTGRPCAACSRRDGAA